MEYKLNCKKPNLFQLILLISFPSVATVLISPALPAMSDFFDISNGYAQQLITIFVIGYTLGQLLYSPFANRFGRKVAIYMGLSLYLVSCLVCLVGIYIHSIDIILVGRLFMALGSSVGMIISFTIINDFYHPKQARKVISYTVLAYAFMPALSITLGGFITSYFSWTDCFYFLLIYGFVIFAVSTCLPETLKEKNHHALKIKSITASYVKAFRSKRLVLFSLIYGLMTAFIYIIASGAPFIGVDEIGLSPATYGFLLLIPYCGQFIGSITAGKLSHRMTAFQGIRLGYACVIFGTLFMFISFLFHWVTAFSLTAPIFFIMIGLPITYSCVTMMALLEHEDKATGSAVMTFLTMGTAFFAALILTLLPNQHPIIMPALFILVIIAALIVFEIVKKAFPDQ